MTTPTNALRYITGQWSYERDDEPEGEVTVLTRFTWPGPDSASRLADEAIDCLGLDDCHPDEAPEYFYIHGPNGERYRFEIETEYEPRHTAWAAEEPEE